MRQEPASSKLAYSIDEASGLISVSRAHLYRLLDSGEMKSIHIGRSRRITHGQLKEFLGKREAIG